VRSRRQADPSPAQARPRRSVCAGTATLQECTLPANTAGSAGGGLFNGSSGALAVKDSTVLNNVAPLGADLDNLGVLTLDDSTVGVLGP
jgi:hypothetical protein